MTETTWCITAPQPKTPDASATPTPSASTEEVRVALAVGVRRAPRTIPGTAYAELDQTGSSPLPCDSKTKQEAEQGLDALAVQHITTRYCVVSSQGQDLGCYTTQSAAAERQRETGQQHLLELIGQTARLEERPTIEIVAPSDPRFQSIQLTCQTDVERASKACAGRRPGRRTRSGIRTSRATPCTSGP